MELELPEAVRQIHAACTGAQQRDEGHPSPFVFVVGAGISKPQVPTAREIEDHCRGIAKGVESDEPSAEQPMARYSYWFERAYPQVVDRQEYLQSLISGQPIPQANLRLAHLLSGGAVSSMAITPNFDPFLSQGLRLFGFDPVVCDHPRTTERIDPEQPGIQIVHVHGSHLFYDACNLTSEVMRRANASTTDIQSMAQLLDATFRRRSPIVVGYSGWEEDVIMSALSRRLGPEDAPSQLRYNLYWFCHRRAEAGILPTWLTGHPNVCLILPPIEPGQAKGDVSPAEDRPSERIEEPEPTLEAREIFEALIREFDVALPSLTTDPLLFLVDQLRSRLPLAEPSAGDDVYGLSEVVRRVEIARDRERDTTEALGESIRRVEDSVRRSEYASALRGLRAVDVDQLSDHDRSRIAAAALAASLGLDDDSDLEISGYQFVIRAWSLVGLVERESTLNRLLRQSLRAQLIAYERRGNWQRIVKLGSFAADAFRSSEAVEDRRAVAFGLVKAARAHREMGHRHAAETIVGSVVDRFGDLPNDLLQREVADALIERARLARDPESEIAAYDAIATRYINAADVELQSRVGRALISKALALGTLDRTDEQFAVYEDVATRYADAPPTLRQYVARAEHYRAGMERFSDPEGARRRLARLVEAFSTSDIAAVQWHVAAAMLLMAEIETDANDQERALEAIGNLVDQYLPSDNPFVQSEVINGLLMRSAMVANQDPDRASKDLRLIVDRFGQVKHPWVTGRVNEARQRIELWTARRPSRSVRRPQSRKRLPRSGSAKSTDRQDSTRRRTP